MCYTETMSKGKRTSRFSFYRASDGNWHFQRATQFVGPSTDGLNYVVNNAKSINIGGASETRYQHSMSLVTNLPEARGSLLKMKGYK